MPAWALAPPDLATAQQMVANSKLRRFDFETDRLIDPDGDGWPSYMPPYADESAPYVYFRSPYQNTAMMTYPSYTPPMGYGFGVARPYLAGPPLGGFVDAKKFQIICAGLDGHYGVDTAMMGVPNKQYPIGANYTQYDEDNITSFSEGGTLGDKRP
jgi:hypothetical protein